jgi:hypothetical protein
MFFGYMPEGCWLVLPGSGLKLRNVEDGWEVQRFDGDPTAKLDAVLAEHGVDADGFLRIAHVDLDGRPYDTVDRVQVASALLQDIVKVCP